MTGGVCPGASRETAFWGAGVGVAAPTGTNMVSTGGAVAIAGAGDRPAAWTDASVGLLDGAGGGAVASGPEGWLGCWCGCGRELFIGVISMELAMDGMGGPPSAIGLLMRGVDSALKEPSLAPSF